MYNVHFSSLFNSYSLDLATLNLSILKGERSCEGGCPSAKSLNMFPTTGAYLKPLPIIVIISKTRALFIVTVSNLKILLQLLYYDELDVCP